MQAREWLAKWLGRRVRATARGNGGGCVGRAHVWNDNVLDGGARGHTWPVVRFVGMGGQIHHAEICARWRCPYGAGNADNKKGWELPQPFR